MMQLVFLIAFSVFTTCSCASLLAQEPMQSQNSQPIILENADSLVGRSTDTEIIRDLIGNVVLRQGDAVVRCAKAIQYITRNRATLIGNVVFTQGTVTIETPMAEYDGVTRTVSSVSGLILRDRDTETRAQTGTYNTELRIARFVKNVDVQNDSIRITSDTLEYRYATQNSYATGNVFASGKHSRVYLLGDSLVHIKQTNYARVRGADINGVYRAPLLYQIDSTKKESDTTQQLTNTPKHTATMRYDTLTLTGNVLESLREDERELYIADGAVAMVRGSLAARGERGQYVKSRKAPSIQPFQHLTMTGLPGADFLQAPLMWLDSTQLYGDSLYVRLQNNRPEEILALGKAFSISQADSSDQERCNQLSAERIAIAIVRDTVRTIRGTGKAFSVYFQFEEDSTKTMSANGATRVSADTIIVSLDSGTVRDVVWLNIAEGEYIPEHIAERKVNEDLKLKNFRRDFNRPMLPLLNATTRKRMETLKPNTQQTTKQNPDSIKSKKESQGNLPVKKDSSKKNSSSTLKKKSLKRNEE
jgi:lipopolysaccharide export system protein LptA